jgi:hypothetical protein
MGMGTGKSMGMGMPEVADAQGFIHLLVPTLQVSGRPSACCALYSEVGVIGGAQKT